MISSYSTGQSELIEVSLSDLNSLEVRPPRPMITIAPSDTSPNGYAVSVEENLGDHVLAVGPRYEYQDIKCVAANFLGRNTSGVLSKNETVTVSFRELFHVYRY